MEKSKFSLSESEFIPEAFNKTAQSNSENSGRTSSLDLEYYQYREVSSYSDHEWHKPDPTKIVRRDLPNKKSEELIKMGSDEFHPAKKGIVERLKAKKRDEFSRMDISQIIQKQKAINFQKVGTIEPPKESQNVASKEARKDTPKGMRRMIPMEAMKLSPKEMKKSLEISKSKVDNIAMTGKTNTSSTSAIETDGKEPLSKVPQIKLSAKGHWGQLRAIHRVGGFYSEVHKKHRYLTMTALMKKIKKQQKKIPIVHMKANPVRAQNIFISIQPDPMLQKLVDEVSSRASEFTPKTSILEASSKPSFSDTKQRITFMEPSHEKLNKSATATKASPVRIHPQKSNLSIRPNPSKQNRKTRNKPKEVCHASCAKPRQTSTYALKTIFDDIEHTEIVKVVHKQRTNHHCRSRGGQDTLAETDPPIRLSEAIAAIVRGYDPKDVVLIISPVDDDSNEVEDYLQITVVEWYQAQVLGSFLIPADNIMSPEDEDSLADYFWISVTQTLDSFQNDLCSVLKYLSNFVLSTKRNPAPCSEQVAQKERAGQEPLALAPENESSVNPDSIFRVADRDGMIAYAYPDFLSKEYVYSCNFFSTYERYMFSCSFEGSEILKQLRRYPNFARNFQVVTDPIEIMFPTPSFLKKMFRSVESVMKTLKIVKVYDVLCQMSFAIYKNLFF